MKIERHGFVREMAETKEGIIFQCNYPSTEEISFAYYLKDYDDPNRIYAEAKQTVARFIVKSKLPF